MPETAGGTSASAAGMPSCHALANAPRSRCGASPDGSTRGGKQEESLRARRHRPAGATRDAAGQRGACAHPPGATRSARRRASADRRSASRAQSRRQPTPSPPATAQTPDTMTRPRAPLAKRLRRRGSNGRRRTAGCNRRAAQRLTQGCRRLSRDFEGPERDPHARPLPQGACRHRRVLLPATAGALPDAAPEHCHRANSARPAAAASGPPPALPTRTSTAACRRSGFQTRLPRPSTNRRNSRSARNEPRPANVAKTPRTPAGCPRPGRPGRPGSPGDGRCTHKPGVPVPVLRATRACPPSPETVPTHPPALFADTSRPPSRLLVMPSNSAGRHAFCADVTGVRLGLSCPWHRRAPGACRCVFRAGVSSETASVPSTRLPPAFTARAVRRPCVVAPCLCHIALLGGMSR